MSRHPGDLIQAFPKLRQMVARGKRAALRTQPLGQEASNAQKNLLVPIASTRYPANQTMGWRQQQRALGPLLGPTLF